MKLWIDDIRPAPQGYIWCKSVHETKLHIMQHLDPDKRIRIEEINLDHDAGDYASQGGDYIKILDWLEEYESYGNSIEFYISIHSGNSVGRDNMMRIIKKNGWLNF